MGKLQIIVGGQFGSEGKGALTAWLARREHKPLLAIRVAGPNAGHTAYDDAGNEFKLQQIPAAAVVHQYTPGQIALAIAAGSEIDEATLKAEVDNLQAHGHSIGHRLIIDGQATRIESRHVEIERGVHTQWVGESGIEPGDLKEHGMGGLTKRIGSTGKGVGAARAARIMREAELWKGYGWSGTDVAQLARTHLRRGGTVQVEGTQGFGLGLHAGYYPYCTSSDCRAIDFLSMAGISPWASYVDNVEVWVALRTYPIRVAGDSGPLERETTWEAIGQPPEHTTVTKKIRRVGQFDGALAIRAIAENGDNVKVALMFADYADPLLKDRADAIPRHYDLIRVFEELVLHDIHVVGTGPRTIAEVHD